MITRSMKFLLSTLFVLMCVMAWTGKSALQASEENMETTWVRFSNEAQAQHAKNVALSAALQDPRVKEAIAKAKQTGDPEDIAKARALLERMVRAITENIADMRRSHRGWGEIALELGVHPSVLGLGHSKARTHCSLQTSKKAGARSKIRETVAKNSKGDREQGHGGGHGSSNGGGHGGGKK